MLRLLWRSFLGSFFFFPVGLLWMLSWYVVGLALISTNRTDVTNAVS